MELFKLLGTIAINNTEANNAIDSTTSKAQKSEPKISEAFKKIGTAVVTYFAVDKIKDFGQQCINMASDVQEMQNKFDVVFQGMTDEVEEWASSYAEAIGRNSNTIKGYLADNQNMFVGMGMTREEGAKLSEQMVSLALDLASFNNLNETDAVNAFSKAIMGETESAKRLGAVLNDNTRAMAMEQLGYEGKYDALTEAEKMEVNYQAILMQSADAVGDCERSLDSYKGQTIQLQSAKEKLFETIGTMLIPAMTLFVGKMTEVVTWIQKVVEWADKNRTALSIIAIAVGTLTTAIIAYNIAQNAAAIVTAISTTATTAFGAAVAFLTSPITLVVAAIGALIAIGVLLYKNWDTITEKCGEFASSVKETIIALKDKIVDVFQGMKDTLYSIFVDGIWGTIKNVINWVLGGIEGMANGVVNGVNTVIRALNNLSFDVPDWVPAIGGSKFGFNISEMREVTIPRLEKGGVLEKGQTGFLEGNGAEAVVPLENNHKWIASVARDMKSQGLGGASEEVMNMLHEILDAIKGLNASEIIQVVPDSSGIFELVRQESIINAELGRAGIVV